MSASACSCAPRSYCRFEGVIPEYTCPNCERAMEDEARQEKFEMEYEGIDPQTGRPWTFNPEDGPEAAFFAALESE